MSLGGGDEEGFEGLEEDEFNHQPSEVCSAATGGGLADAALGGSDATATRSSEAAAAASPGRRRHAGAPLAESQGSIFSAAPWLSPSPQPEAVAAAAAAPHWSARRPPTAGWTWTALSVAREVTAEEKEEEEAEERESAALQSSADDGERASLFPPFSLPLPPLPSAASASASPAGVIEDLAHATAEAEQKTSQHAAVMVEHELDVAGGERLAVVAVVAAASAAVDAVSDASVLRPNHSSDPPPPPKPKPKGSAPWAIAGCASLPTSEGGPRLEGVESRTTPLGLPPTRLAASAAADAAGGSETAMRAAPPLVLLPCLPLLLEPPPLLATGLDAMARRGVGKPGLGPSEGNAEEARERPEGGRGATSEIVQTAASAALDATPASPSAADDAGEASERGTASAERVQSPPSAKSVAGSVGCAASAASGLLPSHFTRAPRRSPAPTPYAAAAVSEEEEELDLEEGEEKLTAAARRFADPGGQ